MSTNFNVLKNRTLFGKYKPTKIIGKGSFGCVFQGTNILDNSQVAIKVESKSSKAHLLEIESNFLSILKGYGIPEVKSFGYHGQFYILVEELLGLNLQQIKCLYNDLTLKDISMIAIQILDRIEYVHSKNIIHRDIKPENFVFGYKNNNSTLYIIDFGISRKYRSARKHLKFQLLGKMFGTVRFASYNASRGVEQSRRDDLESIGYMLIYLATGKLPWQGISLRDQNHAKKYTEMLLLKKYLSYEVICRGLPSEFIEYIKYCRNLSFEQNPDYEYLRNLFRNILIKLNTTNDLKFSWIRKRNCKNRNLNKNKYINFLRRKQSSQTRLFKAIQQSLGKEEKRNKEINSYSKDKNKIILINKNDNNDNNMHFRGTSEEETQNTKFDVLDSSYVFSNKGELSKDELAYNSLFAHYNMNVIGFQDEQKIFEENITRINSIKNKKVNIYSLNKNNNSTLNINDYKNNIELNTYNYNEKKAIKQRIHLLNSDKSNKDKENNQYNLSLILDKKYLKELKEPNINISSKSEKINLRNILYDFNINPKIQEIDKEREKYCTIIYKNIISKINNYLDKLEETKKYKKLKYKKNLSYTNILNTDKTNIKTNFEQKDKLSFVNDSFSFKNYNINQGNNIKAYENKHRKNNSMNNNKNNISENINSNMNKINEFNINNNININQNYKVININNEIKNKRINSYNFKVNNFKNITDNNNNHINIIINNNVSNYKKISTSPTSANNSINIGYKTNCIPNCIPYSKFISIPQNNINKKNILHKKFYSNNNICEKDERNINNYINKIPINNNNKKINNKLIPNITKPIKKNYFYLNQSGTFNNNMITNINTDKNNINNNSFIINNNKNIKNIKIMQYMPKYNTQNQNYIENNNIINNHNYCNNNNLITNVKNIRSSFTSKQSNIYGQMKVIQLNNKNKIKTSPHNYKNILMNKANNYQLNKNYTIYKNNMKNNNYSNDIQSYALQSKNINLDNSAEVNNNQKIYIALIKKINNRQYSPANIRNNNLACFLNNKNIDFKTYNNRSNSNQIKRKCFNYYINYKDELESLNHIPKNINKINSPNKKCIDSKCFNMIKI